MPKEKAQKVDAESSARSRPQRKPQVHHNVECDSCGLSPIRGARYKSLVSLHALNLYSDLTCCPIAAEV